MKKMEEMNEKKKEKKREEMKRKKNEQKREKEKHQDGSGGGKKKKERQKEAPMKEPYPSQKHHVLIKLEMARSGQGWRRRKICLTFLSAKIRNRDSSRQTFGVTESRTPIISTNRSLMSIPNMAPVC